MIQKKQTSFHIVWLRANYWIGALVDAIMVVPLLASEITGAMFGIDDFRPGADYRYAAYVAASLMAGWTALLLWADRRPIERKGVVILTLIPVLVGLIWSGAFAVRSGLIKQTDMLPTFVMQGLLCASYLCSYVFASIREKNVPDPA